MSKQELHIPTDLDIMMFHDGELSGEEAKRVSLFLESDEDASAKATSLGQIGELIRGNMELAADSAEDKLAGLWGGIESGIQKQLSQNGVSEAATASASVPAAEIVPIGSAAKKAEERATAELVEKASWFGGWQSHIMTGAIVAAAVAVLMVATRSDKVEQTTATRQVVVQQPTDTIPVALKTLPPVVEQLEVYEGSGTIMMVAGESEESSAVIWISNDTDLVKDPI